MPIPSRLLSPFFATIPLICLPVLVKAAPANKPAPRNNSQIGKGRISAVGAPKAAPKTAASLPLGGWKYAFAEDELEARWSWRGQIKSAGDGEIRVAFDYKDDKNYNLLRVANAGTTRGLSCWQVQDGQVMSKGVVANITNGEVTLQRVGKNTSVLVNGERVLQVALSVAGEQFGVATRGKFTLDSGDVQPTAPVEMRDDFMRAEGPEDKEVPGEWQTVGLWKTSGTLGPKSDAALNPNPFVFRGSGSDSVAQAGKWFWSDYVVSVSLKATAKDDNEPLIASVGAYVQGDKNQIRGEIDFKTGIARLVAGGKVLAQSAPFDAEIGQWHRVRLEPGPGVARLLVDGIERVRATSKLGQGPFAITTTTGGGNYVDFDDVRVGSGTENDFFKGEGALPQRFGKDRLMQFWANDARLWKRAESGVWWHIGDFFGDSSVAVPIPKWEIGQGVALVRGQSNTAAPAANDSRVTLTRGRDGYLLEVGGYGNYKFSKKLTPAEVEGKTLAVSLKRQNKSTLFDRQIVLGDKVLRVDSLTGSGHKVGVLPLQNSAPMPPPATKPVTLYSDTFGRDGQAYIGVNITPVTEEIRRQVALPDATGAIIDHVDEGSPAQKAGVQIGDVIRGVNGVRVLDVETMRGAVGAARPGSRLKLEILRAQSDGSKINWALASAKTPDVMDYSFTTAPVDWRAARGKWEVSERWTCSPQWSFFAGTNDIVPVLWSRYATQGDWTLEAYLATPMDQARGERSPSDINLTVGGDGVDLSSGYSFLFAAQGRSENQLRRGDAIAFRKPFEMPQGAGDTHQDWFYTRIEKRTIDGKVQFKWSVNGREIANYADVNPLKDNGQIAFWSKNGGLSIARVRLWHSGIRNVEPLLAPRILASNPLPNDLGFWSPRGAGRDISSNIQLISDAPKPAAPENKTTLKFTNPQSGGDWTVYVTKEAFDPQKLGKLEWDYKMGNDVKVNLFAKVEGTWREIAFAGPTTAGDDQNRLGAVANFQNDDKWHHASFDIQAALQARGLGVSQVQALAFAAPSTDYLQAGFGGNKRGATWYLRNFHAVAN